MPVAAPPSVEIDEEITLEEAIENAALDYLRLTGKLIDPDSVDKSFIRLVVEHLVKKLDDPIPANNEWSRGADWGTVFTLSCIYRRMGGALLSSPSFIVSNEEVEQKHRGNFGSESPRFVIDEGVIDHAFGYGGGSTRTAILISHGLIRKPRTMSYKSPLTEKGFDYLRSLVTPSQVKRLIQR